MNTSVRTRHAARGFSMVELLITIIIAGIVFAGMVPLFVTVLGKNADDNMRNISAFLAQDKVERLRQLDYMEITPTNLNSSTFKSGQFGNTVPYQTGAGTKNFTVSYSVATLPSDATSLTEQYKEVAVDVYWIGPPLPVKHVYQVARIYRQYAGPSVSLGITPAPDANGAIFDPASPNYVKLTATVPEAWRGITNGVPATSKVTFTIARDGMVGDSAGDSQDVLTSDITTKTNGKFNTYRYVGLGVYEFTWVGAAIAPLDLYKFTVVAYASDAGSAGEETGLYASLESNTPDPPTGLVAVPGPRPRQVSLEWNPCPDAFFDHFEVYRSLVSNSFGTTPLVTITENENPTYVDDIARTLTGGTTYYYRLKVVTKKGATFYSSLPCAQVWAIAPTYELADDIKPPSASTLTATKVANQPTITLTWTASVDSADTTKVPNIPASGLANYAIYRSADGTTWGAASTFPSGLTTAARSWTDAAAGYATKWYYKIEAYDKAGNKSTSAVVNATTDPVPQYTLTVTNANKDKVAYVWVRNMVTPFYYYTTGGATSLTPAAVGQKVDKGNKTAKFTPLPPGSYQVYANFSGTSYVSTPVFSATGAGPYVCTVK